MHIEQKVNIHNRFDVEVRDAKTGELKQKATGFNIVLDQMWTRLCGGSSYFVNIHFGTGGGTLSPSRTSLFTHLDTKTAADEEQVKALPVSRWKRKIVLNPEEFVGSTITEVGIAFGSTASNLVTHAMLKDSEGNPISITKTDVDIVTIYATVFVTINNAAGIRMLGMPSSNTLINYLIGGAGAPAGTFGLLPGEGYGERLGSSASATWTADTLNKKRKSNLVRFDINTGNGNILGLNFTNLFSITFPKIGVFEGQSYSGVVIGTGDGATSEFKIPSLNLVEEILDLKKNGVTVQDYTVESKPGVNFWSNPNFMSDMGGPEGYDSAENVNAFAMATGYTSRLYYYDEVDGEYIRRPNNPAFPALNYQALGLSGDGNRMALGFTSAPYIALYDWFDNKWNELQVPNITTYPKFLRFSSDGNTLAVGFWGSRTRVFKLISGSWTEMGLNQLPATYCRGLSITPNGNTVAMNLDSGFGVFDWNGTNWVARPLPTTPAYSPTVVAQLADAGNVLLCGGSSATPIYKVFDWNGTSWEARPDPPNMPASAAHATISKDGSKLYLSTQHTYAWDGSSWLELDKYHTTFSAGNTKFSSDGLSVFSIGIVSYIVDLKERSTRVKFNVPPEVGAVITADYTVKGVHKTNQYVIDVSFAIAFGVVSNNL